MPQNRRTSVCQGTVQRKRSAVSGPPRACRSLPYTRRRSTSCLVAQARAPISPLHRESGTVSTGRRVCRCSRDTVQTPLSSSPSNRRAAASNGRLSTHPRWRSQSTQRLLCGNAGRYLLRVLGALLGGTDEEDSKDGDRDQAEETARAEAGLARQSVRSRQIRHDGDRVSPPMSWLWQGWNSCSVL